jgi:hypothetical protein
VLRSLIGFISETVSSTHRFVSSIMLIPVDFSSVCSPGSTRMVEWVLIFSSKCEKSETKNANNCFEAFSNAVFVYQGKFDKRRMLKIVTSSGFNLHFLRRRRVTRSLYLLLRVTRSLYLLLRAATIFLI